MCRQELHRAQLELREVERSIRDLPLRASLAIAGVSVVILAAFVAWFSRQLVIPTQRAWAELEGRVADRTKELARTVDELESEIHQRHQAEAQKDEMHRQLLDASRRAGMAELANGVLHNVGNVLNSVNVSADLLGQRLRESRIDGLSRVAELLQRHAADLPDFFASTQKGRALPAYIEQLSVHLRRERDLLVDEAGSLSARIDHIRDIVDRQQSYARSAGVTTTVSVSALAGEAVEMQRIPLQQAGVAVHIDASGEDRCDLDRARVLQILTNVIGNARHAIRDTGRGEGHITIRAENAGELLRYRIEDDGVGIEPENLERVFGHGFTTKKDGHGFGLHHSANAATEMGGRLWAESKGLGHGTTLVLELPLRRNSEVMA